MKWFNVEIEDMDGVRELAQYLRQNKIKYETSDLDGHGKHFEIFCDERMATKIDVALDRIFDHIADINQNNLNEDANSRSYIVKIETLVQAEELSNWLRRNDIKYSISKQQNQYEFKITCDAKTALRVDTALFSLGARNFKSGTL